MKRIISVLMAIIIVFSVAVGMSFNTSAESLYIKKIVSVVYDDSGSMKGAKWAYANYAMQAFAGMLNSEDKLFITYMSRSQTISNYQPQEVDLSTGNIQRSINEIKGHSKSGSTPYKAVDIAYNKLKSVEDDNPNTQYWLVVITDGAFDEMQYLTKDQMNEFLDKRFSKGYNSNGTKVSGYVQNSMPNGSKPQITFLGIGDVASPTKNESKGIYTYSASNETEIMSAMSKMADKVSGRTRLQTEDIKKIDGKTIQVSSSIPLMNIAVLSQKTNAKIVKAVYSNESSIPISRQASLGYSGYSDLLGGAFLVGDSKNVIGAGTYKITFDKEVDLKNIVVLFEPALEMRMTLTVNGKKIKDYSELDDLMEGDKITASCKIYEMGTEKEVSPSLMPPNTKFQITVTEDGKQVKKVDGEKMVLSKYSLKNVETEIKASMLIKGFNPIERSAEFIPKEYSERIVYTIESDFGNNVKSVKLKEIADNADTNIQFTVYANDKPITDPEEVKKLNPVITLSPKGNEGDVTYTDDGKIVFTPKKAAVPDGEVDHFDVEVTCTLENGVSQSESYTVLVADYQVVVLGTDQSIKKTEFFDNEISVSFYITKDGKKLKKSEVEDKISVALNKSQSHLKTNVVVANDGTITVTPYSEEEYKLTFFSWFINWWKYFGLQGDDITVTLNHSFGTGSTEIDVVGESIAYQIFSVYLPLILEIALLIFIIWWIYAVVAKPKFAAGTAIYYAPIHYSGGSGDRYHKMGKMEEVYLSQYNSIKYIWKPTLKPEVIPIGKGIEISAGYGGSIICNCEVWAKTRITPYETTDRTLKHPNMVKDYIARNKSLCIEAIDPYDRKQVKAIQTIDGPKASIYYVHTKSTNLVLVDEIQAIRTGTIFAYANIP